MAKRVFLHIGRAKTGSSSIQRTLRDNTKRLAALGFCYPGEKRNHNYVVQSLADKDLCGAEALLREVREAESDVIVSGEGFQNLRPAIVREWLGTLDVQVIVYLREQAEVLASSYQQRVKDGLVTSSFEEYAETFSTIDYVPFLDAWSEAFGRDHLTVRIYDTASFANESVVLDLLTIVGIDPGSLVIDGTDANPSIAGPLLEAKRRLNLAYRGTEQDLRAKTYQALLAAARTRPNYRGAIAADPAFIAKIRSECAVANQTLAHKYFGGDTAFHLKQWPTPSPFDESQVADALIAVISRM